MKYCYKGLAVEAHRWFRNGDHPQDGERTTEGAVVRYFRRPDIPGDSTCECCGQRFHDHGWIESGYTVCPGDWVITDKNDRHRSCDDKTFRVIYVVVEDVA